MNPKIISSIKAVLMALLTFLPVFGLGKFQGIIDLIISNIDPLVEAILAIISIVGLFFAWRPSTDEQTKGAMIKADLKTKPTTLSDTNIDKRSQFFNA